MKANNDKTLRTWLSHIDKGWLLLPRFQRPMVWKKKMVEQLLASMFEKKPMGVFWVLETDPSNPLFQSRNVDGKVVAKKSCKYLLLDGQQRITALWKAFNDRDAQYSYYAKIDREKGKVVAFVGYDKKRKLNIDLAKDSKKQHRRNLFPVHLLNPLGTVQDINIWVRSLGVSNASKTTEVIKNARETFSKVVIPYFQLPKSTDRSEALDVFQKINTNSVTLTNYHLAASEMEKQEKKCLYSMAARIDSATEIEEFETSDDTGELALKIFCLMQDKVPTQGNYMKLPFGDLIKSEQEIKNGIDWAIGELKKLRIHGGSHLPSVVPLRVLPAIHKHFLAATVKKSDANEIVNKYLWHSFLTDRYEKQANDRLKEDYDDLRDFLLGGKIKEKIRIFDKSQHPVPSEQAIALAGWPKPRSNLPRGILLACCQKGAASLGDNEIMSGENYNSREKHHIFPKSQIKDVVAEYQDSAVNCMLVPSEDNKEYSNELPGDYMQKLFTSMGEPFSPADVRDRLETHLISQPLAKILVGVTFEEVGGNPQELMRLYKKFVKERSIDIYEAIRKLLRV